MLYNARLETFVRAADAGSFSKAADELFITPTAIIKQIKLLEAELGVTLFIRSHTGVSLTDAGRSLYQSAVNIIRLGREAVQNARRAAGSDAGIIRIGVSPLTPADAIFRFWPALNAACPDMRFQLIPYENTLDAAVKTLGSLGTNIDVVAGIFDDELLRARKCSGLVLFNEPICAAVSLTHRLAGRGSLSADDLCGENLMVIKQGWCDSVDRMRCDLQAEHPEINIIDFDFYNIDVFNQCQNSNDVLMAVKIWTNVHPLLKIIPVEWPYTIPFGIFHAPEPSATVAGFLDAVKHIVPETQTI